MLQNLSAEELREIVAGGDPLEKVKEILRNHSHSHDSGNVRKTLGESRETR